MSVFILQACGAASDLGSSHPNAPSAPLPVDDVNYTVQQLGDDIAAVLAYHQGIYSDRPLGNSDNVALWTDDKMARFLGAVSVAQKTAYTGLALPDLAHLILAEAAAESTGDFNVGIGSAPSAGWGLLQVTPDTVVFDYNHHGQPITAALGAALLDPNTAHDLGDPGVNALLWAWYTKNAVAFGISADQAALGERGDVVADYGNALFA